MIGAQGQSNYPAFNPDVMNATGQILYKGEVVQMDWLQANSASTPSSAQTAAGIDAVQLGTDNAIVPTTNGVLKNSALAVVLDDVVQIGSRMKVAMLGFAYLAVTSAAVAIGDHLVAQNASVLAITATGTGPGCSFAYAVDASTVTTTNANGEKLVRAFIDGLWRRQSQGSV